MKNLCVKTVFKIMGAIMWMAFYQPYTTNAQCGNDAGIMPNGFFPACDGNFVTTKAINSVIADENSSLIYIIHRGSENNSTILLDSIEAYNTIGLFYNDGSIRRNQDLFVSGYVGPLNEDGLPILDDECAVVALPGTPVRFYEPIGLNVISNNCDMETGCLTVQFSIVGGAPGFPSGAIFFLYEIEGDFNGKLAYGEVGSFTVCNEPAYTINVVSDGKNCSGFFEVAHQCCQNNLIIDDATAFKNLHQSNESIITSGEVEILNGQQVEYNAPKVRLNNTFSTKTGAEFKVRNSGCN